MKSIHWGIIGCGDVTEVKSGPAFNRVNGSTLTAVMRRNAGKAQEYARRHNVPKWYSDADLLLNDPDINAVYIATPPSSHKEYVLKALAKGMHVYVEKPVTLNASEARELSDASRRAAGKLSVAHYRRALDHFLFIRKLLNEKTIGEVRVVTATLLQSLQPTLVAATETNWRTDPAISGGGLFHDLSPHLLDLMLYYFGTPLYSNGFSLNQSKTSQADDMVSGHILFSNNIVFTGIWNFAVAASEEKDECRIVGSEGSISFSLFGSDVTLHTSTKEATHHFDKPVHIQEQMIARVVEYFLGNAENPCTIDDAVIVMGLIDSFTKKQSQ